MPSSLDSVLVARPELDDAASVLRALTRATIGLPVHLADGVPHLDAARIRLTEGIPALAGERLVSASTLLHNMRALGGALEQTGRAAPAGGLLTILDVHGDDLLHGGDGPALAAAALDRDVALIAAVARRLGADEMAMLTIADHAVRPALRAGAERVRSLIDATAWDRGMCPACGAPPLLAELRSSGERWLRCGRCCCAWMFPRVGCPSCGTRDHRLLGYLHLEGEAEHRRADRCEGCHGYVKAMAVLGPLSYEELLAADLVTLDLDLIAAERGYTRV